MASFLSTTNKKATLASLQTDSRNILNIFSKTIDDLSTVNNEILNLKDEKESQILDLQKESMNLSEQAKVNDNVIRKLNSLFV